MTSSNCDVCGIVSSRAGSRRRVVVTAPRVQMACRASTTGSRAARVTQVCYSGVMELFGKGATPDHHLTFSPREGRCRASQVEMPGGAHRWLLPGLFVQP